MRTAPCKDCTKETGRHLGCHDRCPRYQDWKAELTAGREALRMDDFIDFNPNGERRALKWTHGKRIKSR